MSKEKEIENGKKLSLHLELTGFPMSIELNLRDQSGLREAVSKSVMNSLDFALRGVEAVEAMPIPQETLKDAVRKKRSVDRLDITVKRSPDMGNEFSVAYYSVLDKKRFQLGRCNNYSAHQVNEIIEKYGQKM